MEVIYRSRYMGRSMCDVEQAERRARGELQPSAPRSSALQPCPRSPSPLVPSIYPRDGKSRDCHRRGGFLYLFFTPSLSFAAFCVLFARNAHPYEFPPPLDPGTSTKIHPGRFLDDDGATLWPRAAGMPANGTSAPGKGQQEFCFCVPSCMLLADEPI